jgi:hypothetical protein
MYVRHTVDYNRTFTQFEIRMLRQEEYFYTHKLPNIIRNQIKILTKER